jgi:hypothetical protein
MSLKDVDIFWGTSSTYQKKEKNVHINMCPETSNFELYLKEYIYNKRSKCPARDAMHALTRLIMDINIRSKIPG